MNAVQITQDTLAPRQAGTSWCVHQRTEGDEGQLPAPGTPVRVDHKGKGVAFGLADDGPIAVRVLGRHPEPVPALIRRRLPPLMLARTSSLRTPTPTVS